MQGPKYWKNSASHYSKAIRTSLRKRKEHKKQNLLIRNNARTKMLGKLSEPLLESDKNITVEEKTTQNAEYKYY